VLIQKMEPGEIAGAGLVIGAIFLLVGVTGIAARLSRLIPQPVTAGIQLGLGLSLAGFGLRLVAEQLWLGVVVSAVMLALLGNRRFPAALVGLAVGIGLAAATGTLAPLPTLTIGLHLPPLVWPTWAQVLRGTELAVLPQVPLTLTNAIIVTAAVTKQLFPREEHHVSERTLSLSTGIGNLLAAPFGGYLMCRRKRATRGPTSSAPNSRRAPLA
jgi:predicted benzoate:H+ symporter BenE